MRYLALFALVAFAVINQQASAGGATLNTQRARYHSRMDEIALAHEQKIGTLCTDYAQALDQLASRATQAGDLNGARASLAEIERFTAARDVTAAAISDRLDLKRLQLAFMRKSKAFSVDKAEQMLRLSRKYDAALLRLQKLLTMKSQLDDATAVQSERERLAGDTTLQKARALLSQGDVTARAAAVPEYIPAELNRLSATPAMRGKFAPSTRKQALCLTFEKGLTDKIKKPPIQWANAKIILNGRFGKGCTFLPEGKLVIGPVSMPDRGSFAIWVRIPKGTDMAKQMRVVDSNGLGLIIKGGRLHASLHDGKTTRIGATDVVLGEWMHLGVTWGEGEKRFYVNGRQHAVTPYAGKPAAPVRTIHVGCRWTGTQFFFPGDIDEILMYDRCLSAREMAAIAATSID